MVNFAEVPAHWFAFGNGLRYGRGDGIAPKTFGRLRFVRFGKCVWREAR